MVLMRTKFAQNAPSCTVASRASASCLNPNKGWGWNQPTATLKARHVVCDEVRSVKPSCNFHF